MHSLNERILRNLLTEREMAYAKKSLLEEKGLSSNKITDRLDALNAAIGIHAELMLEDKEAQR